MIDTNKVRSITPGYYLTGTASQLNLSVGSPIRVEGDGFERPDGTGGPVTGGMLLLEVSRYTAATGVDSLAFKRPFAEPGPRKRGRNYLVKVVRGRNGGAQYATKANQSDKLRKSIYGDASLMDRADKAAAAAGQSFTAWVLEAMEAAL